MQSDFLLEEWQTLKGECFYKKNLSLAFNVLSFLLLFISFKNYPSILNIKYTLSIFLFSLLVTMFVFPHQESKKKCWIISMFHEGLNDYTYKVGLDYLYDLGEIDEYAFRVNDKVIPYDLH